MPIGFFPIFHPANLLLIPAILFTLWAQMKVKSAYYKYSNIGVRSGARGVDIAERILQSENIRDVTVECIPGEMTDHFDPRTGTVRLSEGVYHGHSIAALGIAAHELGHVIQHAHGYAPMQLRQMVYPVSSLGSTLAFPIIIIGILLSSSGYYVPWLITAGIWLFAAAVAFTIITLPVEFNASRRALRALADGRFLTEDELAGARAVLQAAALTYVAAAAAAVLQLLRLLLMTRNRD